MNARSKNKTDYDLCVIGGGINGAGIARDAAGRGLSVLLLEAQDLASGTSSASTKLIHGGLRYLEYFEFKLVRESLREREVLLSLAPHIIRPMEFVLPHKSGRGARPVWMIRLGLFLYDNLSRRKTLRKSGKIDLKRDARGKPLKSGYKCGFHYADCWADDSRLVALNAQDAVEHGATILTRTKCTKIEAKDGAWDVSMHTEGQKKERSISAAMVINAAGPWVNDVVGMIHLERPDDYVPKVRRVKGSHIITKRLFEGDHAYILQQKDGRIVFAIPYEDRYTLIGTTEEEHEGDPADARLSDEGMDYLIAAYNSFFTHSIEKDDVLWSYSGVRPLFDEGGADGDNATKVSRDYKLYVHPDMAAPMISVFGGKLTTYRVLAEEAVSRIMHLGGYAGAPWTEDKVLPGGNIVGGGIEEFEALQGEMYPWMPKDLLHRYVHSYGARMDVFLEGATCLADLGQHFGDDVCAAEIDYLMEHEFAKTEEDIFWRRSKLGLHISDKTIQNVAAYLKKNRVKNG